MIRADIREDLAARSLRSLELSRAVRLDRVLRPLGKADGIGDNSAGVRAIGNGSLSRTAHQGIPSVETRALPPVFTSAPIR